MTLIPVFDAWIRALQERGESPLSRTLEHAYASGDLLFVDYEELVAQDTRGELKDPGPLVFIALGDLVSKLAELAAAFDRFNTESEHNNVE